MYSIFLATFPSNIIVNEVTAINKLCCLIRWEKFKKDAVMQCYWCQEFNHATCNCNMLEKCLKCSEHRQTKDCNNINKIPYGNCNDEHHANSKECHIYVKIIQK